MRTLLLFCLLLSGPLSQGQHFASIESTSGYTVNVELEENKIIAPSNCQWGYNYNVEVNYNVYFTGNNTPNSLWTLQGNLGCGNSSHFFSLPTSGGTGKIVTNSNVWTSNTDCAEATLESLGCSDFTIKLNGPGIANQTITLSAPTTLPIELTYFDAYLEDNTVLLSWETASELNNNFFTVQRSEDGDTWKDVLHMDGAGNSNTSLLYTAYDKNPSTGVNYYRLKQTDFDGRFSYSDIEVVTSKMMHQIVAYPNPTKAQIFLQGLGDLIYQVRILDLQGRTVGVIDQIGNSRPIDISWITPGTYTLALYNKFSSAQVKTFRISKIG